MWTAFRQSEIIRKIKNGEELLETGANALLGHCRKVLKRKAREGFAKGAKEGSRK
jgi:hypothetical protein